MDNPILNYCINMYGKIHRNTVGYWKGPQLSLPLALAKVEIVLLSSELLTQPVDYRIPKYKGW